jgi:hypothetical protein
LQLQAKSSLDGMGQGCGSSGATCLKILLYGSGTSLENNIVIDVVSEFVDRGAHHKTDESEYK